MPKQKPIEMISISYTKYVCPICDRIDEDNSDVNDDNVETISSGNGTIFTCEHCMEDFCGICYKPNEAEEIAEDDTSIYFDLCDECYEKYNKEKGDAAREQIAKGTWKHDN